MGQTCGTWDDCACDVVFTEPVVKITASDALLLLKKAVGLPGLLRCNCRFGDLACSSLRFESRPGSDLDGGWTGIAHDSELVAGASISAGILRRCSDSQQPCQHNGDCANQNCVATCDCGLDPSCEITGPTQQKKCLTTLTDCSADRCLLGSSTQANACATNDDCSGGASCTGSSDCATGVSCVAPFGPPLPLSSGGTPVCVVSLFDGPLSGTANSATGEGSASLRLRSRVFLGITLDKPCPRCGAPDESPKLGDGFHCSGGVNDGQPCRVDGVSGTFGGTSFDCPPSLAGNISGSGLATRLQQVTTGTTTRNARLTCSDVGFRGNPWNAPANPGTCLDDASPCSTNADCRRCSGDPTLHCGNDGDCSGKGSCSESPDQPISCGFWCHCGFCDDDPSSPCFQDGDCSAGQHCKPGTGSVSSANAPQRKPNDCSSDKFVCGMEQPERCANTVVGKCSDQPYRSCTEGSSTCGDNLGGTCIVSARPCFGSRIVRSGKASPLGSYCFFEDETCSSNSDCTGEGDFCLHDSSHPETVALFCLPSTGSSTINNVGGVTGPGALRIHGVVEVCRCGDSKIGCDESCDDGNQLPGDGCDELCHVETSRG